MGNNDTSDDLMRQLVDAFHTLLDEPLITAIAGDRDLGDPTEYEATKTILEQLAQDVVLEEASGFNPSGLGAQDEPPNHASLTDPSTALSASAEQSESKSQLTDTSSADLGSSSNVYRLPSLTSFDNESSDDKIKVLLNIFPDMRLYDVEFALKKAKGDFQTALDDLLQIQDLKAAGQELRGIDGFFKEGEDSKPRKGKKKKGKGMATTPPAATHSASPDAKIRHAEDIGFLVDALGVPFEYVSELYYKKHCSSGATVVELLDISMDAGLIAEDEESKRRSKELSKKYENVPADYMRTLVQMASSNGDFLDHLADMLSKHFTKHPWTKKLDIGYRLTPLPRDELEGIPQGKLMGSGNSSARSTPPVMEYNSAVALSQHYFDALQDAQAAVSKLNRSGGASKHLYRQAAGVYVERAQEHGRSALQARSMSADILVQQTATANKIDLHGVTVQDGLRISLQKVQSWWQNLGEFRSRKAKENPFTIITGVGKHSAGGVSQLRRAIVPALLQDGWKLEIGTAGFDIVGRR